MNDLDSDKLRIPKNLTPKLRDAAALTNRSLPKFVEAALTQILNQITADATPERLPIVMEARRAASKSDLGYIVAEEPIVERLKRLEDHFDELGPAMREYLENSRKPKKTKRA